MCSSSSTGTALGSSSTAIAPPPHVIFTGGDPLKRPDLGALVREAAGLGLGVSVAPSATTRLTADVVGELKAAGVEAMSMSLDGATAARHDGIRGVPGCFDMTLRAAGSIVAAGIPLQINTLVCRETVDDLEAIAALVAGIGARRWSLFFLIAVGRGRVLTPLSAAEAERTLEWAASQAGRRPFVTSTTEAPHYRRIVVQRLRRAGRSVEQIRRSPVGRGFAARRRERAPDPRRRPLPRRSRVPRPAGARDVSRALRRLRVPRPLWRLARPGMGDDRRRARGGSAVRVGERRRR